jgi:hypothetical protein
MPSAFSDLQDKLDRFMEDQLDTDASGDAKARRFPLPTRIYSWNWAQLVLVHHTPRQRSMTLEIDTDERSAVLPDDFFEVMGIYDSYEEYWWRRMSVQPGDYRDTDSDLPEYWIWDGKMLLERDIDIGSTDLTLYYWAYYPDVEFEVGTSEGEENPEDITYTQETVYTPRWAESAMLHLCTAFCWQPLSIEASDINEWRIEVDAGTPMHNPRQSAAWDHYRWWNELLGRISPARRKA